MATISEDQDQELEALQAIYPKELVILSQVPGDVRFAIKIKCDDDGSQPAQQSDEEEETEYIDPEKDFSVSLEFILPEEYPNEVPSILIQDRSLNIMMTDEEELLSLLDSQAKDNLGMVMSFTLIQSACEWLNRRKDEDAARKKEAEERRLKELEEAENRKFEGTRVTVESFMRWKLAFDEEMAQLKIKRKVKSEVGRLTGRELFERDQTMADSDLKFLGDDKDVSYDDQGVKVDTSLFDDEDIDDEDYVPDEDD